MDKKPVVMDACCMLNLLATGRELEIVRALDLLLLETPQVNREPMYLSTAPDEDGVRRREPASTDALRSAGFLRTYALSTEELINAFVLAAARINDADASCIAVAGILAVPFATDDRKERKIAAELFPEVVILSTLDLIQEAALELAWSTSELVNVATNLRWRGNFAPPRRDLRGEWYLALLDRAGIAPP
jgi:predicted nucleic acid-binding protein